MAKPEQPVYARPEWTREPGPGEAVWTNRNEHGEVTSRHVVPLKPGAPVTTEVYPNDDDPRAGNGIWIRTESYPGHRNPPEYIGHLFKEIGLGLLRAQQALGHMWVRLWVSRPPRPEQWEQYPEPEVPPAELCSEMAAVLTAALAAGKIPIGRVEYWARKWDADPETIRQVIADLPEGVYTRLGMPRERVSGRADTPEAERERERKRMAVEQLKAEAHDRDKFNARVRALARGEQIMRREALLKSAVENGSVNAKHVEFWRAEFEASPYDVTHLLARLRRGFFPNPQREDVLFVTWDGEEGVPLFTHDQPGPVGYTMVPADTPSIAEAITWQQIPPGMIKAGVIKTRMLPDGSMQVRTHEEGCNYPHWEGECVTANKLISAAPAEHLPSCKGYHFDGVCLVPGGPRPPEWFLNEYPEIRKALA